LPLQSSRAPLSPKGWPPVERVGDQCPCPSMTAQPRGRQAKGLLVDGSPRSNQPRSYPPKQPRHPSAGARPGRSHPSPPIASRVRGRSPMTPWRLWRFLAAALPRRRPLVEDVPSLALECRQLEVHSRTLAQANDACRRRVPRLWVGGYSLARGRGYETELPVVLVEDREKLVFLRTFELAHGSGPEDPVLNPSRCHDVSIPSRRPLSSQWRRHQSGVCQAATSYPHRVQTLAGTSLS